MMMMMMVVVVVVVQEQVQRVNHNRLLQLLLFLVCIRIEFTYTMWYQTATHDVSSNCNFPHTFLFTIIFLTT